MKRLLLSTLISFIISHSYSQWETQNSGTTLNLNSVYFINSNSGYAVGDSGIILKTIDGGSNWTLQNSGTIKELHSVYFCDLLNGFSVGD